MTTFVQNLSRALRKLTFAALMAGQIMTFSATEAFADVKRIPISTGQLSGLLQSCLLQGGGDHRNDHDLPAFCCATNDEGTKWCVACYAGTEENPSDC